MFFPQICQVTQHQPVPIHFVTKQNVLLFFKIFWLVNRLFWPVWLFLGICAIAKAILLAVRRKRAAEATRRRDEVRSGQVQTIPGDEALARVRGAVGRTT